MEPIGWLPRIGVMKIEDAPRRRAALRNVMTLLAGGVLAACSVVGMREGTEEPRFEIHARLGDLEIRDYGPRLAAETLVSAKAVQGDEAAARNEGFRRVAGYIFGGNRSGEKIAMTAPVAQATAAPAKGETIAMTAPVAQNREAGGGWRIRFFLPADRIWERLPVPNDPAVELVRVPGERMAVLRFSGDRGADAVAMRSADLLRALEASAWRATAAPVAWFYDPPWTIPGLRRNEVAVAVAPR